ncbi:sporulation and cell division repeat protein [Vibrio sp. 16]|nr:sporulation and cell division repeat protein [Vibrio sp. 16]
MEKRVRNAYRTVARRPGEIMALGDHKVEKRIIIRSIIGSPINIALVVMTLLLLVGAGYWWMMSQPSPNDKMQQITQSVEQTVIPTLPDATSSAESTESNSAIITPDPVVDPMLASAEDDSQSLPPAVTSEVTSVGSSDDGHQRVVITSEVVDALLDDKPETVDTSAIDQVVEASIPEDETPEPESASEPEVAPQPVVNFSFTKEELKAFSPRSYTLQLAAVTDLADVQAFLDTYQLKQNVYIYPTVRNDVEWFIITYDNFPTIQVARDGVAELSDELQQLEPWAKSLSQVHREIERGK